MVEKYPAMKQIIVRQMLNYKDKNRLFLKEVIARKIPYLAAANEQTISELINTM
jgi:hypothetical protein